MALVAERRRRWKQPDLFGRRAFVPYSSLYRFAVKHCDFAELPGARA
ncbi:MAG: hypothetical protein M3373_02025 [Gemmatimonadota bacterium]|nr:hypothetical protein [Gemmatimonadota bacterium]